MPALYHLWHCCADQPVGKRTEIQSITTIAACTQYSNNIHNFFWAAYNIFISLKIMFANYFEVGCVQTKEHIHILTLCFFLYMYAIHSWMWMCVVCVCACVYVCERERERERERLSERERERERMCVCVCVCVWRKKENANCICSFL